MALVFMHGFFEEIKRNTIILGIGGLAGYSLGVSGCTDSQSDETKPTKEKKIEIPYKLLTDFSTSQINYDTLKSTTYSHHIYIPMTDTAHQCLYTLPENSYAPQILFDKL